MIPLLIISKIIEFSPHLLSVASLMQLIEGFFVFSIKHFSDEWFQNPTKDHPLEMLTLKTVPSLNCGVIEDALAFFPRLCILDLAEKNVGRTLSITDALLKKPELVIRVNGKIYVRSTLKAVSWARLKARFDMWWWWCSKCLVAVSFHASGVPMLETVPWP